MKLFISVANQDMLDFPTTGPHGINGTYNTIFVASPKTAMDFVSYLRSCAVKQIYTGRRGKEYMVGWDGKYVDVDEWKKNKRTSSTSAPRLTAKLLISKKYGSYHGGAQQVSSVNGTDYLWNFVKVVSGKTQVCDEKEAEGIVCNGKFLKL